MLKKKVPFFVCIAAFNLLILPGVFSQKKLTTVIVDAGHGGTKDPGATGQYENSLRSKEKDVTLAISLKLVAELKKQMPDLNVRPTRTTDIYQDPREKARIANDYGGQLFLCIHADSGPLKQGKRQVGTREETRYKITYKGKGRKRQKISTPYSVTVPVYEYFKMPLNAHGTSVWIFAPHKTDDKLKAILDGGEDFEIESDNVDSTLNEFDFKTSREGKLLAQIYADRFQLRSNKLATFVNEEIDKTGRKGLGVSQRQKGIWVLQATNMPAILVETGFINNPEDERYINSEEGQQEIAEAITAAVKRYKQQIENINKQTNSQADAPKGKEPVNAPPPPYETRATKETKVLQVKSNKVKVEIYDDGEVDNDIVSVYFNKDLIVDKKSLTARAHTINLELVPGKNNELVLFADNLGDIPPNTALMVITDGTSRYEVRLAADLKTNASIRFEFKQPN